MSKSPSILILVVVALVTTLCYGCGGNSSGEAQSSSMATKSRLTVTLPLAQDAKADTIHLGRIHEGEIITSAFTLKNTGTEPLVIVDIKVDCSCTQTKFDTKPIMMGESRRVDFSFNSDNRADFQQKYMDVQLAGGKDSFKVYFSAEVISRN